MAKINILPSKVYNRIAAGEVVDRPYSVVKELVENAIDAGATEIEIHVERGGKQLIRVIDNGCGIERDDLQSAFLPHATSKIAKAEDLDNILTLGFRGEAVASIAAVSQMTITSRVEGQKCYQLSSNGGELGSIIESTGDKGTDVKVEMLFFNAPVRLNFLKSDKAEETDITTFVSRFILNRSDIAFTYYVNGKKVLQSFGEGDEEALVCVYGAGVRSQCIQIDA
jgi:DNA mismatch repair protein MutL